MNKLFKMMHAKRAETEEIISEMEKKSAYTISVLDEIYAERCAEFQKKQEILSSLLEEGDFETAMNKIHEAMELMATSDEAIKNRLLECNLKNCK